MSALQLVIGTGNAHKVREIAEMLSDVDGVSVIPFTDIEPLPEVDETGATFAENAGLKALLLAKYLRARGGLAASGRHTSVGADTRLLEQLAAERARERLDQSAPPPTSGVRYGGRNLIRPGDELVLADDSGLAVDALGGAPGIYSARYAGTHGDDAANNRKLLRELADVPDERRTARFVCAMALATQRGVLFTVEGTVEGRITRELRGEGGFGYDPLFFYPPYKATFGEVAAAKKNAVSHRGAALKLFRERFSALLAGQTGHGN